jgi:hypothetical protein
MVARPPHARLRPLETEKAGVERAMTVKCRRRLQAHAQAPAAGGAHEGAVRRDLGRIHELAELGLDLPGFADVRRRGDGGERRLRIVAGKKAAIEHQPHLVLHGVGRLRP